MFDNLFPAELPRLFLRLTFLKQGSERSLATFFFSSQLLPLSITQPFTFSTYNRFVLFFVYSFIFCILYSQNHVKCSRQLCSLPGLQGQKIFADAIINFLIPFKSISDQNWNNRLFINEVVKILTFQFGESVTKFYVVKYFWILMKFS